MLTCPVLFLHFRETETKMADQLKYFGSGGLILWPPLTWTRRKGEISQPRQVIIILPFFQFSSRRRRRRRLRFGMSWLHIIWYSFSFPFSFSPLDLNIIKMIKKWPSAPTPKLHALLISFPLFDLTCKEEITVVWGGGIFPKFLNGPSKRISLADWFVLARLKDWYNHRFHPVTEYVCVCVWIKDKDRHSLIRHSFWAWYKIRNNRQCISMTTTRTMMSCWIFPNRSWHCRNNL